MIKKSKNLIILFVVVILILVNFILADFVFAGSVDVGMEYGEAIGLEGGGTDIRIIMVRIIRYALGFLGIIAVSVIMYGGWLWMTSGGDPAKVDKAKSTLKNAVIGLVIILSSFAIVSFILRGMGYGGGLGGPGPGGGPPGDLGGTGALGNCTVETVYPEPNQEEVPRNTAIIITFREEVDPTTICDDAGGNNDGNCDIGEHVIPSHVKISEVVSGVVVSDVNVQTNDNRTFLFMPVEYLGSPSEYVWHSVYLSNDILKLSDGTGMFDDCRTDYFEWSFEVSNVIDLDPPYVLDGGVFPAPDDQADTIGTVVGAVQATGNIAVNNQPNYYQVAVVNNIQTTAGPTDINVNGTYICSENNTVNVSINPANNAVVSGVVGLVPGDDTTDDEISIGCGLTLTPVAGSFAVGNSWSFDVYSEVQADSLTVGSIVYTFVSGAPTGNQIESNANNNITAGNIAGALAGNSSVSAVNAGNIVNLTAVVAGEAGNNIYLSTTNTTALVITAMSGGSDTETITTIFDKEDKPRNAVIQINFNEAINPMTVSGDSGDVSSYIRVINIDTGGNLVGKFLISNQYRTVEFISDDLCGVNGCGEQIYCLPENSHLQVELVSANLATCVVDPDCASRAPYINCSVANHCQNNASGENFPLASLPLDGISDAALNSLDGNRDGDADGPINFYDENSHFGSDGDNYMWSFFISDQIDLSPPIITSVNPTHSSFNISSTDPIVMEFDKLMMSNSLTTGATQIFNGQDYFTHQLINLWNFTSQPVGYWVANENFEVGIPDGEPDLTRTFIRHTEFTDATSYRAQAGSGIKTIYQNCFKPSSSSDPGSSCTGNPSCCPSFGVVAPSAGSSCP